MACFLGIDGGGTRTTAWLADERGRVLARAEAGPSNPVKIGFESAEDEILRAAQKVLRKARLRLQPSVSRLKRTHKPAPLAAVCLGIAGSDRPSVRRRLLAWLRKSIPARCYLLTTDAAIALRAALGDAPGVIVISGTGSIAYAQDECGCTLRAGGWGPAFDDAGSGYDVGRKAISASLRAFDGRGPATRLAVQVPTALHLRSITGVVLKTLAPSQMAALSPLVLDSARRGDLVARHLCEEAGRDLAELAVAVIRRLGWENRSVPVVCAGGIFRASLAILRSFAHNLHQVVPAARVKVLRCHPVEGALALAREAAKPASR